MLTHLDSAAVQADFSCASARAIRCPSAFAGVADAGALRAARFARFVSYSCSDPQQDWCLAGLVAVAEPRQRRCIAASAGEKEQNEPAVTYNKDCLLYTSDAADE